MINFWLHCSSRRCNGTSSVPEPEKLLLPIDDENFWLSWFFWLWNSWNSYDFFAYLGMFFARMVGLGVQRPTFNSEVFTICKNRPRHPWISGASLKFVTTDSKENVLDVWLIVAHRIVVCQLQFIKWMLYPGPLNLLNFTLQLQWLELSS